MRLTREASVRRRLSFDWCDRGVTELDQVAQDLVEIPGLNCKVCQESMARILAAAAEPAER